MLVIIIAFISGRFDKTRLHGVSFTNIKHCFTKYTQIQLQVQMSGVTRNGNLNGTIKIYTRCSTHNPLKQAVQKNAIMESQLLWKVGWNAQIIIVQHYSATLHAM